MPRPPSGLPQWEAVAVKLPPDLLARARRYADLYHTTVSALLREGLEQQVGSQEGPSLSGEHPRFSPDTLAMLTQLAQTLTTAAAEVQAACQPLATEEYNGNTTTGEGYNGNTSPVPPVLQAVPVPALREAAAPVPLPLDAAAQGARPDAPVAITLGYDATKYALGDLCKHGHNYEGTGQSLRRLADHECLACQRARAQAARQRKRQAAC